MSDYVTVVFDLPLNLNPDSLCIRIRIRLIKYPLNCDFLSVIHALK